jgi:glycosyltransferase involved in cell wall biosynthesis
MKNLLIISAADLTTSYIGRKHYFIRYLSDYYRIFLFNTKTYFKYKYEKTGANNENISFLNKTIMINSYPLRIKDMYISEAFNMIPNYKYLSNCIKENNISAILNFSHDTIGHLIYNKNIPYIYDLLDYRIDQVGHDFQSSIPLKKMSRKLLGFIQNNNLKGCTGIVACSKKLLYYAKQKYYKNNTVFIPNGTDLNLMNPKKVALLKNKHNFSESDLILGYIGGINWLTEIDLLYDLIKEHPIIKNRRLKLLIVGSGSHYEYYKSKAYEMDLSDVVTFTGYINRNISPEYINLMDIGLIPFKKNRVSYYSFPLKAIEYLACGKPLISSFIPAIKELHDKNEFREHTYIYKNESDIYECIKEILYKDIKLNPYKNHIRKELKNYDWKNLSLKYKDYIDSIIN